MSELPTKFEIMSLDYATIHLCNALLNFSYGCMLLALWVRRRETHLLLWASSLLLVSAAVYGFTLNRNPIFVSILLAAVSANISLTWAGARGFDGRQPYHWTLALGPALTFLGYLSFAESGLRPEGSALATLLLAANVACVGSYFLRKRPGYARKATGWVLLAYVPLYITSIVLDFYSTNVQAASILILVGDFVLNNAFVVGLFAIMEERAREQLRVVAATDQLTGALNRAGLFVRLPDGQPLNDRTLLLADLDHFKSINDTYGHNGGDMALKTFVARTREFLGENEFIVRLGGEEFGIVLATDDLRNASRRAEQIRHRLAAEPVAWAGKSMAVTASIGVAVSQGLEDFSATMCRADAALYRAKQGGRNQIAA